MIVFAIVLFVVFALVIVLSALAIIRRPASALAMRPIPAPALNPVAISGAAGNIEAFCRDGFTVFTVNVTSWSRPVSQHEAVKPSAYYHQEGGLVVGRGLQVYCLDATYTHEVYDLCEADTTLADAYAKALSKATGCKVTVGRPLTYHNGVRLAA